MSIREQESIAYHRTPGEEWKLSHGQPLNIYDAARSYRESHGLTDTGIREILKDERFRNAWGTFKGGYRWARTKESGWALERDYKKKGGIYSTTQEKIKAAEILGWYGADSALERLRNISP
jgi:hypothetical protein